MSRIVRWFGRLAGDDFAGPSLDSPRAERSLRVVVAGVAFALLVLELLLARMFPFFLGNISAFVAIPVAMFGLGLGALALHLGGERLGPRTIPALLAALPLSTLTSMVGLFLLFNHAPGFGLTHHQLQDPAHDALKTVVFGLLFVPSFALGGMLLSLAFAAGARRVGTLYALDLVGSAAACVAAPVLLHFVDLPLVLVAHLGVLVALNLRVLRVVPRGVRAGMAAGLLALGVLGGLQRVFTEAPDPDVLGVRYSGGAEVREVRHRWNDVSRVALLAFGEGKRTGYRLIHDDGISNVIVRSWRDGRLADPGSDVTPQAFPWLLGMQPKRALVMFAGAGQDMMRMLEASGGTVDVTGVELNRLVPALVTGRFAERWNLDAFFARDDVHMVIDEGRAFLNRDRSSYDVIFAASNGAQHASRTGHSRKYLDTIDALESYLDHLAPGGLLVFNEQPRIHKLEMVKRLLAARGGASPSRAVIVLGTHAFHPKNRVDTLLVKPSGFTQEEVDALTAAWVRPGKRYLHYAPGWSGSAPALVEELEAPSDLARFVPTDDRPYERGIDWARLGWVPTTEQFADKEYALDWIKVFTAALFSVLSAAVVLIFVAVRRGERRMSLALGAYFVATGVAYMGAQIGLMAKLELFMGFPLYSIAVVLAAFLLWNGAGAAWVGRRQEAGGQPSVLVPALGAAISLPLTLLVVERGLLAGLGLPLLVKIPLALLAVGPLAFFLGAFYPLGVGLLVRRGQQALVPMSFGLATLSSVLGSTIATVAVLDLGFRQVVLAGELVYVGLAVVAGVGLLLRR